jgi:hypothetical protein
MGRKSRTAVRFVRRNSRRAGRGRCVCITIERFPANQPEVFQRLSIIEDLEDRRVVWAMQKLYRPCRWRANAHSLIGLPIALFLRSLNHPIALSKLKCADGEGRSFLSVSIHQFFSQLRPPQHRHRIPQSLLDRAL